MIIVSLLLDFVAGFAVGFAYGRWRSEEAINYRLRDGREPIFLAAIMFFIFALLIASSQTESTQSVPGIKETDG